MNVDRVKERLEALGLNPHEAALKIGRSRNYIYDFLVGRKTEFKGDGPERVAKVLRCSVAYLRGEVDTPDADAPQTDLSSGVKIVGVVEVGAWRTTPPLAAGSPVSTPVARDARYSDMRQFAYAVRGSGMVGLGITEPMIVVAVDAGDFASQHGTPAIGQTVVVERRRLGMVETSARRITAAANGTRSLVAIDDGGHEDVAKYPAKKSQSHDGDGVEIVGIIIAAIVLY